MRSMLLCLALLCLILTSLGCGSLDRPCAEDRECDFGFFCRNDGRCKPGCRFSIECEDDQVCANNECIQVRNDEDEDGYPRPLDCDDKNPLVNPSVIEICGNQTDDNCDGKVDEDSCARVDCKPGTVRPCYDGKAQTLTFANTPCRKGTQTCNSQGVWNDCQGQILPSAEACNGRDDDCDGQVDEDDQQKALSRSCYTGPPNSQKLGVCRDGVQRCNKGKWSTCDEEKTPAKEICDGQDNDCNGQIDDLPTLSQACQSDKAGPCKAGLLTCDAAKKAVVCEPQTKPKPEICGNQNDDDCDGQIDNGCPWTPRKLTTLSSYPHYVLVSEKRAVISLRDSEKLVVFDTTQQPPTKLREIVLRDKPYGLHLQGATVYVVSPDRLYSIDLLTAKPKVLATFSQKTHAATLLAVGSRLYTRYRGQDAQGQQVAGLCQTDITLKRTQCQALSPTPMSLGQGLSQWNAAVLLAADKDLRQLDLLTLKEDSSKRITLPGTLDDIVRDPKTDKLLATAPVAKEVYIVDLFQGKGLAKLTLPDAQGNPQTPGHVAAADGLALVGHRDGKRVSVIDMQRQKIIRTLDVGIAPAGLALSPIQTGQTRTAWITCPGDNSVWTFTTAP